MCVTGKICTGLSWSLALNPSFQTGVVCSDLFISTHWPCSNTTLGPRGIAGAQWTQEQMAHDSPVQSKIAH
jgi:hypothetical protein